VSLVGLVAEQTKELPGVFQHFAGLLHDYGYFAVAGFLFFEDFGVPLPGETMLIAASLYAGAGHLNVWVVGIVGFLAAVLGDNVGYLIGRKGGRKVVDRWGKYVLVTPERFDRAEAWFVKHGGVVVCFARYVEGLRQLNGVIAGTVEMPWKKFLFFNALGAALWVTTWTSLGYLAGNNVETIAHYFTLFIVIAAAVLVVYLFFHVRHIRRRRRARATANLTDADSALAVPGSDNSAD
jgi:membrane protein DedA with SNARE-associated domain